MYKRITVDLVVALIPEKLLGEKQFARHLGKLHIAVEPPEILILEKAGGIGGHRGHDIELAVEFLKIQSFRETPVGSVDLVVYVPERETILY